MSLILHLLEILSNLRQAPKCSINWRHIPNFCKGPIKWVFSIFGVFSDVFLGYEVTKVVYRGYQASAKLQEMHNNAIEARTQLKLKGETESQAQGKENSKKILKNQTSKISNRTEPKNEQKKQVFIFLILRIF
jgi:hypothetical protein